MHAESIKPFREFVSTTNTITSTLILYLKPDEIYTQGMDGSQTTLFDATFPKKWFKGYEFDPTHDVADIMVDTSQLLSVLKIIDPANTTGLMLEVSSDRNKLIITAFNSPYNAKTNQNQNQNQAMRKSKEFKLTLLDIDAELVNVLEKDCSVNMTLPSKVMYDIIKEHVQFGDNTTIRCTENVIALVTSGEVTQTTFMHIDDAQYGIESFEIEEEYAYKLTYKTRQLERMLQFYKASGPSGKAKVSFDDDHPFMVVFSCSNQATATEEQTDCHSHALIRIYIAPMVATDPINEVDERAEESADALQEQLEHTDMNAMMTD